MFSVPRRKDWTEEEDDKMILALQRLGSKAWVKVAQEIGTGKKAEEVRLHWKWMKPQVDLTALGLKLYKNSRVIGIDVDTGSGDDELTVSDVEEENAVAGEGYKPTFAAEAEAEAEAESEAESGGEAEAESGGEAEAETEAEGEAEAEAEAGPEAEAEAEATTEEEPEAEAEAATAAATKHPKETKVSRPLVMRMWEDVSDDESYQSASEEEEEAVPVPKAAKALKKVDRLAVSTTTTTTTSSAKDKPKEKIRSKTVVPPGTTPSTPKYATTTPSTAAAAAAKTGAKVEAAKVATKVASSPSKVAVKPVAGTKVAVAAKPVASSPSKVEAKPVVTTKEKVLKRKKVSEGEDTTTVVEHKKKVKVPRYMPTDWQTLSASWATPLTKPTVEMLTMHQWDFRTMQSMLVTSKETFFDCMKRSDIPGRDVAVLAMMATRE